MYFAYRVVYYRPAPVITESALVSLLGGKESVSLNLAKSMTVKFRRMLLCLLIIPFLAAELAVADASAYVSVDVNTSAFHGLNINARLKNDVEKIYGRPALQRLYALQNLVAELQGLDPLLQLGRVNDFYNQLGFYADAKHWSVDDYWATPVELIASNGGDCEDFAIAKYLTLKSLGFSDEQLRITYVNAVSINQAHMVLTYLPASGEAPLVLDNLIAAIKPAAERTDLKPVYSFNNQGLWLAPLKADSIERDGSVWLGSGDKVTMWKELRQRLASHAVAASVGRGS